MPPKAAQYTEVEKQFIIERGMNGNKWTHILEDFNRTFPRERTVASIRHIFYTSRTYQRHRTRSKWRPVSPTSLANGGANVDPSRERAIYGPRHHRVRSSSPPERSLEASHGNREPNGDRQHGSAVGTEVREGWQGGYQQQRQARIAQQRLHGQTNGGVNNRFIPRNQQRRRRQGVHMPAFPGPMPPPGSGSASTAQQPLPSSSTEAVDYRPILVVPSAGLGNRWVASPVAQPNVSSAGTPRSSAPLLPSMVMMPPPPGPHQPRPLIVNPRRHTTTSLADYRSPFPGSSCSTTIDRDQRQMGQKLRRIIQTRPDFTSSSKDHQVMRVPPIRSNMAGDGDDNVRLPSLEVSRAASGNNDNVQLPSIWGIQLGSAEGTISPVTSPPSSISSTTLPSLRPDMASDNKSVQLPPMWGFGQSSAKGTLSPVVSPVSSTAVPSLHSDVAGGNYDKVRLPSLWGPRQGSADGTNSPVTLPLSASSTVVPSLRSDVTGGNNDKVRLPSLWGIRQGSAEGTRSQVRSPQSSISSTTVPPLRSDMARENNKKVQLPPLLRINQDSTKAITSPATAASPQSAASSTTVPPLPSDMAGENDNNVRLPSPRGIGQGSAESTTSPAAAAAASPQSATSTTTLPPPRSDIASGNNDNVQLPPLLGISQDSPEEPPSPVASPPSSPSFTNDMLPQQPVQLPSIGSLLLGAV